MSGIKECQADAPACGLVGASLASNFENRTCHFLVRVRCTQGCVLNFLFDYSTEGFQRVKGLQTLLQI